MYATEAVGMFVGPMPCKDFLDRFLPDDHGARKKTATVDFQDVPVSSSKEADLYEPLVCLPRSISDLPLTIILTTGGSSKQVLHGLQVLCLSFTGRRRRQNPP